MTSALQDVLADLRDFLSEDLATEKLSPTIEEKRIKYVAELSKFLSGNNGRLNDGVTRSALTAADTKPEILPRSKGIDFEATVKKFREKTAMSTQISHVPNSYSSDTHLVESGVYLAAGDTNICCYQDPGTYDEIDNTNIAGRQRLPSSPSQYEETKLSPTSPLSSQPLYGLEKEDSGTEYESYEDDDDVSKQRVCYDDVTWAGHLVLKSPTSVSRSSSCASESSRQQSIDLSDATFYGPMRQKVGMTVGSTTAAGKGVLSIASASSRFCVLRGSILTCFKVKDGKYRKSKGDTSTSRNSDWKLIQSILIADHEVVYKQRLDATGNMIYELRLTKHGREAFTFYLDNGEYAHRWFKEFNQVTSKHICMQKKAAKRSETVPPTYEEYEKVDQTSSESGISGGSLNERLTRHALKSRLSENSGSLPVLSKTKESTVTGQLQHASRKRSRIKQLVLETFRKAGRSLTVTSTDAVDDTEQCSVLAGYVEVCSNLSKVMTSWLKCYCVISDGHLTCYRDISSSPSSEFRLKLDGTELKDDNKLISIRTPDNSCVTIRIVDTVEREKWWRALKTESGYINGQRANCSTDHSVLPKQASVDTYEEIAPTGNHLKINSRQTPESQTSTPLLYEEMSYPCTEQKKKRNAEQRPPAVPENPPPSSPTSPATLANLYENSQPQHTTGKKQEKSEDYMEPLELSALLQKVGGVSSSPCRGAVYLDEDDSTDCRVSDNIYMNTEVYKASSRQRHPESGRTMTSRYEMLSNGCLPESKSSDFDSCSQSTSLLDQFIDAPSDDEDPSQGHPQSCHSNPDLVFKYSAKTSAAVPQNAVSVTNQSTNEKTGVKRNTPVDKANATDNQATVTEKLTVTKSFDSVRQKFDSVGSVSKNEPVKRTGIIEKKKTRTGCSANSEQQQEKLNTTSGVNRGQINDTQTIQTDSMQANCDNSSIFNPTCHKVNSSEEKLVAMGDSENINTAHRTDNDARHDIHPNMATMVSVQNVAKVVKRRDNTGNGETHSAVADQSQKAVHDGIAAANVTAITAGEEHTSVTSTDDFKRKQQRFEAGQSRNSSATGSSKCGSTSSSARCTVSSSGQGQDISKQSKLGISPLLSSPVSSSSTSRTGNSTTVLTAKRCASDATASAKHKQQMETSSVASFTSASSNLTKSTITGPRTFGGVVSSTSTIATADAQKKPSVPVSGGQQKPSLLSEDLTSNPTPKGLVQQRLQMFK